MRDVESGAQGFNALLHGALRHKLLVVTVTTLLFALAAFFVLSLTPRYTATAMLLLPPGQEQELSGVAQKSSPTDPFAIRSEADILSNDALALKVIDQLNLTADPELSHVDEPHMFRKAKAAVETWLRQAGLLEKNRTHEAVWSENELALSRVLTAYKRRLSIYNDGRSSTVIVSFWAEDPRLAQKIANAHAMAYLSSQASRRVENQKAATGWLAKEIEARAADVKSADAATQAFRAKYGLVLTQQDNQRRSTVDQELAQLNEQLTVARAAVATSEAKLGQFEAEGQPGEVAATTETISGPVMVQLRQRQADARLALSRLENSFQASSPGLNAAKAEVETVGRLIDAEIKRTRGTLVADLDADRRRVSILENEMVKTKERKLALDKAQIELSSLESFAQSKRAIYESLLNRFNVLLAQTGFTAADAQIIASAIVPTTPSFPKTSLYLLMAFALAGVAGVGAAYAAESIALSRRRPDDVGPAKQRERESGPRTAGDDRPALVEHRASRRAQGGGP